MIPYEGKYEDDVALVGVHILNDAHRPGQDGTQTWRVVAVDEITRQVWCIPTADSFLPVPADETGTYMISTVGGLRACWSIVDGPAQRGVLVTVDGEPAIFHDFGADLGFSYRTAMVNLSGGDHHIGLTVVP